ncbi:MAG TPA: hypothetical protein VF173_05320 [Thermoanaerobaculia bacterium]|nr:hypothetical protein [Thermoanaerobaculia bacterium]
MEKINEVCGTASRSSRLIGSKPLHVEKAPLHSYREDEQILGLEATSAALARVGEILRCLGHQPPGGRAEPVGVENSNRPTAAKEYSQRLIELMSREPALHPYLSAHPEAGVERALLAWAAASGDVAFLQALRGHGWESHQTRWLGLMKSVLVPVLLIALTAFLGSWIATTLQRTAFAHQKTFDLRIEGLRKGQDRSAELYTAINEIYSTIADAEDQGFKGLRTTKLRAQRQKMDSINAAAKLYDTKGSVGEAMKNAAVVLDHYIECLDGKRQQEQQQSAPIQNCSKTYDLLPVFDRIVDAHTVAMSKLLESEP